MMSEVHSAPLTLPVLAVVTAYSCLLGSQLRAQSGRSIPVVRPAPASMLLVRYMPPPRIACGLLYAGRGG